MLFSDSLSAVGKKVPIRLLDISALFRGLRIRAEDFVFVKMDIEGLEYDIVRKMVVSGMLDHLVDKIAVEWYTFIISVYKMFLCMYVCMYMPAMNGY